MRTPTWAQIERYCRKDGWAEVRRSGRIFFEKVLGDGTVLRTHRSFSSRKSMSPGRFKAILRHQLKVSEEEFWRVLEGGVRPGSASRVAMSRQVPAGTPRARFLGLRPTAAVAA